MKITFLGQSGFLLNDLAIDPFLTKNPLAQQTVDDLDCDIVCVTHDHFDHFSDVYEISKKHDATLVAIHEIAEDAAAKGITSEGMNIGGSITVGDWKIKMVHALHSCEMGHPAGFVLINLVEKKTIYHAGDTGLFPDMARIGEMGIDIAMLPIGDRYTMGIDEAVDAVNLIKPKVAIPMHYNTFPLIRVDPAEFASKCRCPVEVYEVGETREV